ncbi:two-component sensor histidine kinase [Lachnospiraceae bacterium KM106-2]|nr:two-component sensor histidine kinase [Lachnospiraceae bacterium KM106-2]
MDYIYQTERSEEAMQNELIKDEISQFDIIHLFGKETLEEVQKKIAKATGLAFITVDYKGEPVTESTCFTKFCQTIRKNDKTIGCCKASDAFGGIQAAVSQKPSIYFCPCGLLEVAIPIVVKGHYLGGFIGGQIRCEDAPDTVSRLKNVMGQNLELPNELIKQGYFNDIQQLTYERFRDISDLISLIINQLSEKELSKKMQKEYLQKEIQKADRENKRLALENKLKSTEIAELMEQLNPYFLVNTLTSISNLATIEDAERTNEMLVMFAAYMKENLTNKKKFRTISEELTNVESYLKMEKIRYGEKLTYSIQIPEKMGMQKIPTHILLSFVEFAIFYGIAMKKSNGTVSIEGTYDRDDVVITIADDGPGMTDAELEQHFARYKGGFEGDSITLGVSNARQRMIALFGEKYDISIDVVPEKGRKITICYPKYFDERIEVNVSDINC